MNPESKKSTLNNNNASILSAAMTTGSRLTILNLEEFEFWTHLWEGIFFEKDYFYLSKFKMVNREPVVIAADNIEA